jgi:iron complex outermembrane receptor protein
MAQDTNIVVLNRVLITSVRADYKTPVTQKTLGDTALQDGYQGQEIPVLLSTQTSMNSNSDGGHSQGYSYVSLRGAGQARINMTLNGVPLNEPEDHGVYTSNYPSFITSIQSVQIQRGVGASSNGTSSFIGSINFQTKNGLNKGSELQVGLGSYNTARFNFSGGTGLSKKNLAFFTNIGSLATDGFRNNSGSLGGSIFVTGGYFGKKRVTRLSAFTGISQNYMAWDGSSEDALKVDYRDNPRGKDRPDLFSQTHIQFQNINIFNKKSKLTSTLFFNYLKGHYDVYSFEEVNTIGYYANENQNSNWFGYIGQFDYRVDNIKLVIGVSANTYRRNHDGIEYYDANTSYTYTNYGRKNDLSGFLKMTYDVDNLSLYLDLQERYADFKYHGDVDLPKQKWSFFNPKAGLKVFINKRLNLYGSVGISHREPTRSVMLNGGLYLTTFNTARPEEVVDYELGANYNSSRVKLQTNLFLMAFRNEIIPVGPLGSNSLPTMVNVDNSLRYGYEVDLQYNISKSFSYSVNGMISKNTYGDDHKYQIFSPSYTANQSLSYTRGKFSINVNSSYYSKSYMDLDNLYTTDGYILLGGNVNYTIDNVTFNFQANNLTNEKYYDNGYVAGGTKYLFSNALVNYYFTTRIKL